MSVVQASLSCIAGAIVCNSSCRRSFLTASHFMSDAYAWFGAAYFIYDMWSMYRVHIYKMQDQRSLSSFLSKNFTESKEIYKNHNNHQHSQNGDSCDEHNSIYSDDFLEKNQKEFQGRLKGISPEPISFIRYCIMNPVMYVHHIFLGSFGLLVIVVSFLCKFKRKYKNLI